MRFTLRRLLVVVALFAVMFWLASIPISWLKTRQMFYAARDRQWSTIDRLSDYPPAGWPKERWENALITPHNVWGNVLFDPSMATLDEMASLQGQLEQIVAETTQENSINSVDWIFALLLEKKGTEGNSDFIRRYRESFP